MTPFASVAILEKLALLKIALCRAPALSNASFIASIFSCNWAVSSIWAVFLLLRLRLRRGFFFLRLSRAGARGDSCGQPVVVRGSRADHHHALRSEEHTSE